MEESGYSDSEADSRSSYSDSDNLEPIDEDEHMETDEDNSSSNLSSESDTDSDISEDSFFGPWEEFTEDKSLDASLPVFRRRHKSNSLFTNSHEPIDFFGLFLDNDFLYEICSYTDKYYNDKNKNKHAKKSHKKKWKSPDLVDIKAFFGLLLAMGIVSKPKLEDYWCKSVLLGTPGFAEIMSFDHFKQILRCLVFYDVENFDDQDRLSKIRKFINHVLDASQRLYEPSQHLTIDESMIKFNGRSLMKVYMPSKPIKYGFKVYMMVDAENSYVLNWQLHEEKGESIKSIVQRVTEGFDSRGFIISMDRFYSTLDVINDLTSRGFGVFGVIQMNRVPHIKKIKKFIKKMKTGDYRFYLHENNQVLLTLWRDKKHVLLVSNVGDDNIIQVQRNRKVISDSQSYRKVTIDCPENIALYARNSRGVDVFDQVISYYTVDHKSVKWYMRIVLHLLSVIINNSFILYCKAKKTLSKCSNQLEFRISIIKALISEMRKRKNIIETPKRMRRSLSSIQSQRNSNSFSTSSNRSQDDCKLEYNTKKYCNLCQEQGKRKRTNYWCFSHEIPVCVVNCYDNHRKEQVFFTK